MRHRRVTFTVPADVLKTADTLAKRLGRSRSWVVTEALRRFTDGSPPSPFPQVSESSPAPYTAGLGEQRLALLEADLALTPEQRLQAAEELTDETLRLRPRPRYRQILQFESLGDFFAWKKRDLLW